jgi:competence protein ComGC
MTSNFILTLFAVAVAVVFFRPLLAGIVRALLLVVKPKLSKEEQQARDKMRNAQILRRMINASVDPSHAAELRALASRG